jgi:hypothetical protein
MTRISMKALLGAGLLAVVAAISLTPAARAQDQQGTMNAPPASAVQPGAMDPAGQPATMAPAPQQSASLPTQPAAIEPSQFHQADTRYPGPKLN